MDIPLEELQDKIDELEIVINEMNEKQGMINFGFFIHAARYGCTGCAGAGSVVPETHASSLQPAGQLHPVLCG